MKDVSAIINLLDTYGDGNSMINEGRLSYNHTLGAAEDRNYMKTMDVLAIIMFFYILLGTGIL